ncbi:MAG: polysaccharide deacetylase family protein [Flavobacteriales bacterium]|nr:polysaccharide deacetylase family protein [Flavobacteriales bacterium]
MKKTIFSFLIIGIIFMAASCAQPKKTLVLQMDDCSVADKINPQEKTVYLVFTGHYSSADNGTFENFDGADFVVNTLDEKGVKGSFFPTGVCFDVPKYKPVLEKIIAHGHYLSAHSYAHLLLCPYGNKDENLVTEDSLTADIAHMEEVLQRFGLKKEQYLWMIPPYEHYNKFSADVLQKLGFRLVNPTKGLSTGMDWMGPEHPSYQSAERVLNNIWTYEKENTLNGAVILLHAMNYPCRTDQDRPYRHLGEIIDTLKSRGYSFKCMSDVIEQYQ